MIGAAFTKEEFDPVWYLSTYSDVRAAGLDPWEHYVAHGHAEGRLGGPVRALELDHDLWRGFEAQALPELRLLLKNGSARERAIAGWVFARHAASKSRWKSAHSAIRSFFDGGDLGTAIIPHKGPWVLGVKAATMCRELSVAKELLRKARDRFGDHADLSLSEIEIAVAENAPDHVVSNHLAEIYAATGLAGIGLRQGTLSRLDRLTAPIPPAPVDQGPLVSVIVPAHQSEATLGTCLRGLTDQSWRNLEIIVVDDASTDNTAGVAEEAAQADPRIRVIRLPENSGAYIARNTGLADIRGAFFTVHDSDDWSHPQKIEAQVGPLLADSGPVACASHWVRTGSDLSMSLWRVEQGWVYRNVSSLMVRAEMREKVGYWDRVRVNADTEYYHRLLAAFGPGAVIEQHPGVPLAFGRNAPQSLTLSSATHLSTQFRGPRRCYLDAALHWHDNRVSAVDSTSDTEARAASLFLTRHPSERPFPAPPALRPADDVTAVSDYAVISGSSHFDTLWYLTRNKDVLAADVDPVRHYLETGGQEDRDPGPLFSDSAWRAKRELDTQAVPLLDYEQHPDKAPAEPFRFEGALAGSDAETALVFAHSADRQIFGAERSLLRALERLGSGLDGPRIAPVTVLPSAVNKQYLEDVRKRSAAVVILPQLWRHRFRPASDHTVSAIRDMIRAYRPAAIHVNTIVLNAPLVAARAEGCPSIVHVRELPAEDPQLCRILGDSARGLRRRILSEADRFIANSPAVADWLDCPDRVDVQSNEIDPALFDLPFTPGPSLRVGLISSNIAKKGVADFVSVARMVAKAEASENVPPDARCQFLLIGPDSADLKALGPLPDNTVHTGYVDGSVAAVEQTDLVLVLSHFAESFGRTTLEAMAGGRPVICYRRGTPPTLIEHGRTGFSTPADDPAAVANAVMSISVARFGLLELSRAARKRALLLSQMAATQRADRPSADQSAAT
ncbi:glycosyltransferase [Nioella sp. MMSF_3534]|uniref:glycosyltransferase n=1 Tax=Nioella sp. MMSF_3534 TaxID=3046720 RepID=UPI0027401301|nr:glycosyltransferase [Nioella sp. MMSF_3534]